MDLGFYTFYFLPFLRLFRLHNPKKANCRNTDVVPPPEQLFDIVSALFHDYGLLKDAQTSIPLFNAYKTVKNILELIKKGYISDPPGISLYYIIGVCSKTNLPIY